MLVHVIGATGRTGGVLCRMLMAQGHDVVPVVRDARRWRLSGTARIGDLTDPARLAAPLEDATHIVNVSYAAWTANLLAAAPPHARLVLTGTARRYGTLDDPAGAQAATAERALLASGRDGVMLHPTMIYGAPEDGTIARLAALIRRYPVLPLPGGGRHLVQPIHVGDVAAAIIAALQRSWAPSAAIAAGGPAALSYAALVRAVAAAAGLRTPLVVPIPSAAVRLLGRRRPALLRLMADRSVDTAAMTELLGVTGRPIERGLAEMFGCESGLGRTMGIEPTTSKTTTWRSTN